MRVEDAIEKFDRSRSAHPNAKREVEDTLAIAAMEYVQLRSKVNELLGYLSLPKFNHPENWVNVQDIFNRLAK